MKKTVFGLILALALLAVLALPAFATEDWTLTGQSYFSDTEDCYVLTEDAQDKWGGIWLENFSASDFTLEFDYYTGFNPTNGVVGWDPTGADGIRVSFFLPEGSTLAGLEEYMLGGGDLGYCGPGYGLELDTFYNPELNDPMEANHIALMKDGSDNHIISAALPQSEDYQWHHLKIVVAGGDCTVYVDETEMLTYSGLVSTKASLLGISAATGDDTNKHAVKNILLEATVAPVAAQAPAPSPVATDSGQMVSPTPSTVYINGTATAFEAYNIAGSNYFKLRDLAMVLNGSAKQFEVGYDNDSKAITLTSGQPYTPAGGELAAGDGTAKNAAPTASKIYLDGQELELTVYNINGNNFFKLRDLLQALDIYVGYDEASKAITVDTSKGYDPE